MKIKLEKIAPTLDSIFSVEHTFNKFIERGKSTSVKINVEGGNLKIIVSHPCLKYYAKSTDFLNIDVIESMSSHTKWLYEQNHLKHITFCNIESLTFWKGNSKYAVEGCLEKGRKALISIKNDGEGTIHFANYLGEFKEPVSPLF
jgi:hypothetical protein